MISGGGGEMDYGSLIQAGVDDLQNMHESIQGGIFDVVGGIQKKRDRRENARQFDELLAEKKRQFDRTAAQDDRAQNLQGIGLLAQARNNAQNRANLRTFHYGLFSPQSTAATTSAPAPMQPVNTIIPTTSQNSSGGKK